LGGASLATGRASVQMAQASFFAAMAFRRQNSFKGGGNPSAMRDWALVIFNPVFAPYLIAACACPACVRGNFGT
jgi:hypothetical protein